jgi:hypothetical protein
MSIIRKANIKLHDGRVVKDKYLMCYLQWNDEYEKGHVYYPRVSGFTVFQKDVMRCPKCSGVFRRPAYEYCPFDGTPLKKMN